MNRNTANRVWTGIDNRFAVRGWHGTAYWMARNELDLPAPRRALGYVPPDRMTLGMVNRHLESVVDGRQAVCLDGHGYWETVDGLSVTVAAISPSHPARIGFNPSWFAGLDHVCAESGAELHLSLVSCRAYWERDGRTLAVLCGYYAPVRLVAGEVAA